jgi:hypothetical protein
MAQRPPWETYNLPPWARTQHLYDGGAVASGNFGDWWNNVTGMNPDAGKQDQNGQYPDAPGWKPDQTNQTTSMPPPTNQPTHSYGTAPAETFSVPTGAQAGQDSGMFGTEGYKVNADNYTLPGFQQFNNATGTAAQNALNHQGAQLNTRPQTQFRGQQQSLANTLLNQANGRGPSVAGEMLKQQTQHNIANQFAMSQAANPNDAGALRNISTNVGNLNQQAAGEGALARAQETMNAQSQLGGLLQGARGQDINIAGENANLSEQGFRDANAAGLGFTDANLRAREAEQKGTMQMGSDEAKAYEAAAGNKQKIWGGLLGGISGAGAGMMKGMGGSSSGAPGGSPGSDGSTSENPGDGSDGAGSGGFDDGGGGNTAGDYAGGEIPGHAKADGDSPKNDTVPTMLSPGEVVLPRSVTQAEDSPEKAAAFLEAMKKGKKPKPTFADVLTYQRKMHGRLQELEKLCYGGMAK